MREKAINTKIYKLIFLVGNLIKRRPQRRFRTDFEYRDWSVLMRRFERHQAWHAAPHIRQEDFGLYRCQDSLVLVRKLKRTFSIESIWPDDYLVDS